MKKLLILIPAIILVAAACNKPVSVSFVPSSTTISSTNISNGSLKDNSIKPSADKGSGKLHTTDLALPKTEDEQDFQIDQNTIKNIEQDDRLNKLENNDGSSIAPIPTPTPPPVQTPAPEVTPSPAPVIIPPEVIPVCESSNSGTVVVDIVNPPLATADFSYRLMKGNSQIGSISFESKSFDGAPVGNYTVLVYTNLKHTVTSVTNLTACDTIKFTIDLLE